MHRALVALAASLALAPAAAAAPPTCLTPVAADGLEPVCNPYAAGPVWSTPHRGSYAQDSSPYPAPAPGDPVTVDKQATSDNVPVIVQVSQPYPDGGRALWFSTVSAPERRAVYKLDFATLAELGHYDSVSEGSAPDPQPTTSGVYNVLTRENRLLTVRKDRLELYGDAVAGARTSGVAQLARLTLPASAKCRSDDRVVGLTITFHGEVAFVTAHGVVGVIPPDPARFDAAHLKVLSLNAPAACAAADSGEQGIEAVSNSLAADEEGGIYPVTTKAQYRVDWDGARLRERWRAPYEAGSGQAGARLDAGSGSTPSVMGTRRGDDRFVVITDGRQLMHLVLFWKDAIPRGWKGLPGRDRRMACEFPVTFGDPAATRSQSEQSVLVRGYASAVVNNALGLDDVFAGLPAQARPLSEVSAPAPGNAPAGVERIDWDPRTRTCRSVWANRDVSIPNAVPTMSAATGLMYGIGLRGQTWGLEGLDWATGASRLWVPAGESVEDNSFFAQTTVGPDGSVLSGGIGGVTVYRGPKKAAPPLACRDVEPPRLLSVRARVRRGVARVTGRVTDTACGRPRRGAVVEIAVGGGRYRRAARVRLRGRSLVRVRARDRDGNVSPARSVRAR